MIGNCYLLDLKMKMNMLYYVIQSDGCMYNNPPCTELDFFLLGGCSGSFNTPCNECTVFLSAALPDDFENATL